MGIDEQAVGESLRQWQGILGLRDWDIQPEVVRGEWRKSADIKIDSPNRMAVLLVSQAVDAAALEEHVVHELVHLELHGLDRMVEDLLASIYGANEADPKRSFAYAQFMDRLESTTQDLTRALLSSRGRDAGSRSKTLGDAVSREIEEGRRA